MIDIYSYPVKDVLGLLLLDMTTGESIKIDGTIDQVQPRVLKRLEEQKERTKKKAEVFTPSWMCNKMNNYCDSEWFGRESVFNREVGSTWETNREKILFGNRSWQEYIVETRLEITCGEAPYIASRYDTTIYFNERIAQFRIVENQPRLEFKTVEHLEEENRGGFGSTGRD